MKEDKKPWEGVDLRKLDFIPSGWPKPAGNIHKADYIPGYTKQDDPVEEKVEEEPKRRGRPRKED